MKNSDANDPLIDSNSKERDKDITNEKASTEEQNSEISDPQKSSVSEPVQGTPKSEPEIPKTEAENPPSQACL